MEDFHESMKPVFERMKYLKAKLTTDGIHQIFTEECVSWPSCSAAFDSFQTHIYYTVYELLECEKQELTPREFAIKIQDVINNRDSFSTTDMKLTAPYYPTYISSYPNSTMWLHGFILGFLGLNRHFGLVWEGSLSIVMPFLEIKKYLKENHNIGYTKTATMCYNSKSAFKVPSWNLFFAVGANGVTGHYYPMNEKLLPPEMLPLFQEMSELSFSDVDRNNILVSPLSLLEEVLQLKINYDEKHINTEAKSTGDGLIYAAEYRANVNYEQNFVYVTCAQCKKAVTEDSINPTSEDELDQKLCFLCYPPWHKNSPAHGRASYHYHKREWKHKIQRKEKEDLSVPMGVEIEMDSVVDYDDQSKYISRLVDKFENVYFEEDGSLMASGVEMVTNPMTLNVHKEFWPDIIPQLKRCFVGGEDSKFNERASLGDHKYGIHINASRKCYTREQLVKTLKFVCGVTNRKFLHVLSGRTTLYGSDFAWDIPTSKLSVSQLYHITPLSVSGTTKYSPVNLLDLKRLEFRFFQSFVDEKRILADLEFVSSLHEYIKSNPRALTYRAYLSWMKYTGCAHKYNNLIEVLKEAPEPLQSDIPYETFCSGLRTFMLTYF